MFKTNSEILPEHTRNLMIVFFGKFFNAAIPKALLRMRGAQGIEYSGHLI
jgi:hypothetical protein